MKLPLRIGLPLLGLLLVGLAFTAGPARLVLLVAAMGVALWCAFSLPPPKPPPELRVIETEGDEPSDAGSQDRARPDGPEGPR